MSGSAPRSRRAAGARRRAASTAGRRPRRPSVDLSFLRGAKRVLLLNPPTADTIDAGDRHMVASVEPYALLRLATWFRARGCEVQYLDCLSEAKHGGQLRRHVRKTLPCGDDGGAPVRKEIYHYGLDADELAAHLALLEPPDLIGVSSIFTWTGEATAEAIAVCKRVFPSATVLLGGNFPTLCPTEAHALGADVVVEGDLPDALFLPTAIDLLPPPRVTDFTSMIKGCPNHCEYCVTSVLNEGRVLSRPPEDVIAAMQAKIAEHGTRTFVFFDDFIQFKQARFLDRLLDLIGAAHIGARLEFALGFASHMITDAFAAKLQLAQIERVNLALETISESRSRAMKRPQSIDEFRRAVELLVHHGFQREHIRAFYLIGLPGQTTTEILRGIGFLYSLGVTPSLTAYTLTPGSGDFATYGDRVAGRPLEELSPYLWRFAHPGMTVAELDSIFRYFHETYFSLDRILASVTDDPVIGELQRVIRDGEHRPEAW